MNRAQTLQLVALPTVPCAGTLWNARSLQSRDNPLIVLFPSEQTLPAVSNSATRPRSHDDFLTLRNLAADVYKLIVKLGDGLGWTQIQTTDFQTPVTRIRDAAQAAFETDIAERLSNQHLTAASLQQVGPPLKQQAEKIVLSQDATSTAKTQGSHTRLR
jgi:hypothetical protein